MQAKPGDAEASCRIDWTQAAVEVPKGCPLPPAFPTDVVVMTRELAASRQVQLEQHEERCDLRVRTATRTAGADCALKHRELSIDLWACQNKSEIKSEALDRMSHWSRQPEFVAPVSTLICIGAMLGAAKLQSEVLGR